jgi:O-antigen/teichoic acid export membrane protein
LARKRFGAANALTVLRARFLGPLLGLVWLWGHQLDIRVICTTWLASSIVSLLFGLVVTDVWVGVRQGFDRTVLRGAFRFGLMLASQSFAFYFLKLADRYVLAHYSTLHDIGIYSFAYTLSNIAYSLSALVIVGLFQPHIVEAHNRVDLESRDRLLGQLTRTSLTAVMAASAVAALVAPYAILLARPGYGDSATVLPWLLLTLIPVVAAYPASTVLMLEGKLWASLVGGALAIAVSAPINLVLVPRISYRGSLIASAVGFSVLALVQHTVAGTWRFLAPSEFRRLPDDVRTLLRGGRRAPPSV